MSEQTNRKKNQRYDDECREERGSRRSSEGGSRRSAEGGSRSSSEGGSQRNGEAATKRSRKKKSAADSADDHNRELGKRGEEAAARFLVRRGYDILEQNWTCFAGEADIIAQDGSSLVFVEVKTRSDCRKGFPAEAVTPAKREKYEKIALAYLTEYDVVDVPVRFDVVSIVVVPPDRALIRHHINAFSAV